MKIGTLSMEVMDTQSGELTHSLHGEERLECIVEAIEKCLRRMVVHTPSPHGSTALPDKIGPS